MSEGLNYRRVIYILSIPQIIPLVKSYYSGMFEWTYAVQYHPFYWGGSEIFWGIITYFVFNQQTPYS